MSEKNLLDPKQNDNIPDDGPSHERDGTLLDPRMNELIPSDGGPAIEPPKKVCVQTGDLMSFLTKAAEGGGHSCEREEVEISPGLKASSCPSGGLSMFRDGKQIYTTEDLTPEERKAMMDFRELNK